MERKMKTRNPYAVSLRSLRMQKVKPKKGKGSYSRKGKNNDQ